MKRPHQISVDLGDALHSRLDKISESTGKSKSFLVKVAVMALCNAEKADISINEDQLNTLLEGNASPKSRRKPRSLTEEDHELIAVWREVYDIPKNARVFAPALLSTIWNARREGLSQEDLKKIIRLSPRLKWIQEQVRVGVRPPLSALLSKNALSHLMLLLAENENEKNEDVNLAEYKRDMLEECWGIQNDKKESAWDEFRSRVMQCESVSQVDNTVDEFIAYVES